MDMKICMRVEPTLIDTLKKPGVNIFPRPANLTKIWLYCKIGCSVIYYYVITSDLMTMTMTWISSVENNSWLCDSETTSKTSLRAATTVKITHCHDLTIEKILFSQPRKLIFTKEKENWFFYNRENWYFNNREKLFFHKRENWFFTTEKTDVFTNEKTNISTIEKNFFHNREKLCFHKREKLLFSKPRKLIFTTEKTDVFTTEKTDFHNREN